MPLTLLSLVVKQHQLLRLPPPSCPGLGQGRAPPAQGLQGPAPSLPGDGDGTLGRSRQGCAGSGCSRHRQRRTVPGSVPERLCAPAVRKTAPQPAQL